MCTQSDAATTAIPRLVISGVSNMQHIQCRVGDVFRIGDSLRIQVTGHIEETLYLFVEAAASQLLDTVDGFHASAPDRRGRVSHVFALCDGQGFTLGQLSLRFEDTRFDVQGATPLRHVALWLDLPRHLVVVRETKTRPKPKAPSSVAWLQCRTGGAEC
jgi:hypothetical protein